MTPEEEVLVEAVTTAFRARGPGGRIRNHPFWHDLDDAGRHEAFARTVLQRDLEASLDPQGLTTTAHAVLARLRK